MKEDVNSESAGPSEEVLCCWQININDCGAVESWPLGEHPLIYSYNTTKSLGNEKIKYEIEGKKYDNPSSLFLYWVLELWILTVKCIQVGAFGCLSMGYEIEQTTVFNFGYCIYHRTRVLKKLDNIEKLIDWIYCKYNWPTSR